jgi:uncharacterized protein
LVLDLVERKRQFMTRLRLGMVLLAVLFPTLTLIPLGSLWLWQHGWLLYWVIGALSCTLVFYSLERRVLVAPTLDPVDTRPVGNVAEGDGPEPRAWVQIEALIAATPPTAIKSRSDLIDLGVRTIEIVALEFHPKNKTPVWNFTIPEALVLTERVSARLRPAFIETIPLGDRLTVGQLLRLYEWRTVAGTAEKLYDLWRVVRVLNPVAAMTQEARERVTRQVVSSLKDDFTRRVVSMTVREVGQAAIDLYSGRLRGSGGSRVDGENESLAAREQSAPAAKVSSVRAVWNEIRKVGKSANSLYQKKPPSAGR